MDILEEPDPTLENIGIIAVSEFDRNSTWKDKLLQCKIGYQDDKSIVLRILSDCPDDLENCIRPQKSQHVGLIYDVEL